jgi:hypothetical protein
LIAIMHTDLSGEGAMASNNKRQRPARARKGEPAADARQAARPAQTTREGEPPGEPAPVPAPQEARPTRMTKVQLERRVHALEAQIAWLKAELEEVRGPQIPWWEKISGSFANDPEFEEAMRLGREWRESFRPKKRSPKKKSRKAKSSDGFLIPIT